MSFSTRGLTVIMDKIGEKIGLIAIFFTMMSISSSPHPIILLLTYLIHESGHLFFAHINRIPMKKFRIGSFRLSLSYDCSGVSYKKELLVYMGGAIFNCVFAFAFMLVGMGENGAIRFFVLCNISLALMNLYPVSTLDGGGILKCAFMMIFGSDVAEKAARAVSFVATFILWLCAVYLQLVFNANVSLLFISIFLLIELCFS